MAGSLGKRNRVMDYKAVAEVASVALVGSELLSLFPQSKANGWLQLGIGALKLVAKPKPKGKRKG